jgi:hypothetical protein
VRGRLPPNLAVTSIEPSFFGVSTAASAPVPQDATSGLEEVQVGVTASAYGKMPSARKRRERCDALYRFAIAMASLRA